MGRQEDRRGARSRLKVLAAAAVVVAALAGGKAAQASTPKILPYPQHPSLPGLLLAHHLTYYGGPVMAYDQNVLVLWGSHTSPTGTSASALNSFLTDMAAVGNSNPYNVPLEYGTQGLTGTNQPLTIDSEYSGTAIQITPTLCSDTSACTLDDSNVQNELNDQISAGHLPAPVQAFGGPVTYYPVLFPSNVKICRGTDCSGVQFCAYHGSAYHGPGSTNPFMYGVIPDGPTTSGSAGCGASIGVGNLESYFSHELTETITDPEVGFATTLSPPLAWYDNSSGGGEVSDICNAQEFAVMVNGHSYTAQKNWSNAANNCVTASSHNPGTASFTVSAGAGLTKSFNASASTGGTPPASTVIGYLWDFGDGATGSTATPSHAYAAAGNYKVQLIITDSNNVSARKVAVVPVTNPPPPVKCVVPKVVGKKLAAAKTKIRKAHCSVGKITHKHASASKRGKVIAESPKPGRRLKNHAKVNLTVGK